MLNLTFFGVIGWLASKEIAKSNKIDSTQISYDEGITTFKITPENHLSYLRVSFIVPKSSLEELGEEASDFEL